VSLWSPRQGTAAAVLASVALLAGCGGGGSSSDSGADNGSQNGNGNGSNEGTAPKAAAVSIADFKFGPPSVKVAAGGVVTFKNTDRASHTATASEGAPASFDTGRLTQGASKPVTFAKPGTYAYVCAFHPYMKGSVVVGNGND
jgi:plastocyanin